MSEERPRFALFWPIVLIAILGLIVWQLDAAFPAILDGEDGVARLIYLLIFLALIIISGSQFRGLRISQTALMALTWVAAFAVLIAAYSYRHEARGIYDRIRGEFLPTVAVTQPNGETVLRKTWDGHFRAEARINGAPVRVLVDTGASIVLLTFEDAARLGLAPESLAFDQAVRTANGRAFVAPITLDDIVIGNVSLSRVDAAIAEQGNLQTSLLGMSFLGHLQEVSFRQNALYLRN